MSTPAQLPQPGEIVDGKYRVDSLLGKGGMGAVFVVRHVQTQRQLALKCMLASLIGDHEAEQRFIREAKLAGNVDHPGVVATYDIGRHRGSLYMVMELLSGEALSARIQRGALSVPDATFLMTTVLEAVAAAHQKGIVHRDLKPDNIFMHRAPDGRGVEPKILDFGISKALSPDGAPTMGLTKTGMMLGTPLYMSPEQVRGDKKIDQRTDVYALGVILYEMLTGSVPFNGNNFADLVLKIVTSDTQPPSSRVPSIPPQLDAVVMRAMHADVNARFADAMSFARALAPFAQAPVYSSVRPRPISSAPPARMPSTPPPPQSLTPFVAESRVTERTDVVPMKSTPWALIAAAVTVVVSVSAWWVLANRNVASHADQSAPQTQAPTAVTTAQPSITQPPVQELPSGVSADAVNLPSGVSAPPQASASSHSHAHATHGHTVSTPTAPMGATPASAAPGLVPSSQPAPTSATPSPAPQEQDEDWQEVTPGSEQIIDPFGN